MALTEKPKKPKTKRQLLTMLEREIERIRKRGNWLTATEDQRRELISDEAFDHALEIFQKVADATKQEAVAYLKSKPPSFETIAFLACVAPLAAKSEQAFAAQKQRTGVRKSRYVSEHESWHNAALAELREHPKRNITKMVTAIIARTQTKASRVAVRAWATDNEKHLRREAIKAARAAQSLG